MLQSAFRTNRLFLQRHTFSPVPLYGKMTRIPGRWSALDGPPRDNLGRRLRHIIDGCMTLTGRLTKPFRTKRAVFLYRFIQMRLFKAAVGTLLAIAIIQAFSLFTLMLYSAYSVSPSTPILQRKAHEHRVAKQIMTMVREREGEMIEEHSVKKASGIIEERDLKDTADAHQ